MAEVIIGPLVSRLQDLALSEAQAMVAVSKDIRSLRDKLMWLQAFLQEADPRRRGRGNELFRVLIQQTRYAAFDAEDAIDEYFLRVDLSMYPGWARATVRFFADFTTQVSVRRSLSRKVGDINLQLEEIIRNKDKYRLEDPPAASVGPWNASAAMLDPTKWDVPMPSVIGRTKEQKQLEEQLLKGSAGRAVVFVLGESGVGKSTLMRDTFHKPEIRDHFKTCRALIWPGASRCINIDGILQEIDGHFVADDQSPWSDVDGRREETSTNDAGKPSLLVIDAELTVADLNFLLHSMPWKQNGSRLVLVMKSDHLFRHACPVNCAYEKVELKGLEFKACKKLFCRIACSSDCGDPKHVEREDIAESQVRNRSDDDVPKCSYYDKDVHDITGGLPLAVVLLSGLLRTKEFPHEWDEVLERLKKVKSKRLNRIMSLSFDDLPHDLKSCFLYFAAFPENRLIDEYQMVRLWAAEGFIQPRDRRRMEQVGQCYLKELVDRGLVAWGPYPCVTIHEKVHEFLQLEAQEASFVEAHSDDRVPNPATVRRLSLQNCRDKYAALANCMPKLRSVLSDFRKERQPEPDAVESRTGRCSSLNCSGRRSQSMTCSGFDMQRLLQGSEFLRVIDIRVLEIGRKLPEAIGNMVHLRYLRVRCSSLEELPASVGKLTNLQTLDVRESSVSMLPEGFWKSRALRHVLGDHLILPRNVGNLKNLQTLEKITPCKRTNWDSSTLAKMINLWRLNVCKLSKDNAEALSAALSKLFCLGSLVLSGEILPFGLFTTMESFRRLYEMELEGKLELPSSELEKMAHTNFGVPNLMLLSLSETKVPAVFINKLAELPDLRELKLLEGSYEEEELVFRPAGFLSLTYLVVFDLKKLKKVRVEEGAMPKLANLNIARCSEDLEVELHDVPEIVDKIKREDVKLYEKITHFPKLQIGDSSRS